MLRRAIDSEQIYFVQYTEDPVLAEQTLDLWSSYYERNITAGERVVFDRVLGEAGREGLSVYRLRSGEEADSDASP